MRAFRGFIRTSAVGSDCEFEFEVDENAKPEDIEEEARQAAFDNVEWGFKEIKGGE